MFDEERPSIESDEERSIRHLRLVGQALVFALVLPAILFASAIAWLWVRDGSADVGNLVVPFVIVVVGVGVGMIYELRKRW